MSSRVKSLGPPLSKRAAKNSMNKDKKIAGAHSGVAGLTHSGTQDMRLPRSRALRYILLLLPGPLSSVRKGTTTALALGSHRGEKTSQFSPGSQKAFDVFG